MTANESQIRYSGFESNNPQFSNISIYQNPKFSLKISYLNNWTKDETIRAAGSPVMFFPSDLSDGIRLPNVILTIQQLPENFTNFSNQDKLDNYTIALVNYLNLKQYQIINVVPNMSLAGNPAYEIIYAINSTQTPLEGTDLFTVKGDKAYNLLYLATSQDYDRYFPTLMSMADSFKLEAPQSPVISVTQQPKVTAPTENTIPVANAGNDQTVKLGDVVMLDGTKSSNQENDKLSYKWKQVSGDQTELFNADTPYPTFKTIPITGQADSKPKIMTFELIVNDGKQDSNPDTVQVAILPNLSNTPVKQEQQKPCETVALRGADASGFETDPKDYNPPVDAIDGDLNTWWANQGVPSWLQIDLEKPVTLCSVEVAWNKGNARTYDFTVSASNDGGTSTDVYNGKSNGKTLSYEKYDIAKSTSDVKHIKLSFTGSSSKSGWVSIKEVRVTGR